MCDRNPYFCALSVYGGWSVWSEFGQCSLTYGLGTMTRRRAFTSPKPENGGANCHGNDVVVTMCNIQPCPGILLKDLYLQKFRLKHYSKHNRLTFRPINAVGQFKCYRFRFARVNARVQRTFVF